MTTISRLRRLAERAGTSVGIVALFAIGFLTGGDVWTLALEPLFVRIAVFEGMVYVGLFSVALAAIGLLLASAVWRGDGPEPVTAGPPVRAVVPAYRDAAALDASVTALLETEYDPLRIAIVVEPGDERTRERALALAGRHDAVERLVNDAPGSKASAINCAVERSDADYVVAFDADERPEPTFVGVAMAELLDGTDVFQGRRVPRPSGPVETLAYCERVVVQAGYLIGELVGFTHCQSSATAFSREAFEAVGGFADVLTEDIYFSHQCYRADLAVTVDRRCTSTMEAPHTLRDLWGQRKRWRIGHVQVSHVRIREALAGGFDLGDLVTVGRAVGAVLTGGVLLVLTARVLYLALVEPKTALVPLACIYWLIAGVLSRDLLEGRVDRPAWTVALAPLAFLGHGVLTVKAVSEYVLTWDGEWYRVTKTGV